MQKRNKEALQLVNRTLNDLIAESKALWEAEDEVFDEESFLSRRDPSILHFLIASGDDITSKQLRDDLMTMLIAGHETTAAVLTWTTYLLATHQSIQRKLEAEARAQTPSAMPLYPQDACSHRCSVQVDEVLGDCKPTLAGIKALRYTMRVINEAMRLYPQPPVLIRRALECDVIAGYTVPAGTDLFISVWNLHRSPALWEEPDAFRPERFGPLDKVPSEVRARACRSCLRQPGGAEPRVVSTGDHGLCVPAVRRRPAQVYRGAVRAV
jgi:beta-ring hydroxylase